MNSIKDKLSQDLKKAMKEKDNFKRDTIRFLMSAIKQIEVDERKELSDDDIMKIIQKSIKQREESAIQYKDAGREELFAKENSEATLLKTYLPEQLSDEDLEKIVDESIKTSGASSIKDMGKVMAAVMKTTAGKADGKRINQLVKKLLSDL